MKIRNLLLWVLGMVCTAPTLFAQNYSYGTPWIPDIYSPIRTVRVRFNVIQDANGNGNFSENNPAHVAHIQRLFNEMASMYSGYTTALQCGETYNISDTRIRLKMMPTNYIKNQTLYNFEMNESTHDNCPSTTNWLYNYNNQTENARPYDERALNIYLHNAPSCFAYMQSRGFVEEFVNGASQQGNYCSSTLKSHYNVGGCSMLPESDLATNSYMTMEAVHMDYERKKNSVASYRSAFNNPALFFDESPNVPYNSNNTYFWTLGAAGNIGHEVGHALIYNVIHDYQANCMNVMKASGDGGGNYWKMEQLGAMHYSLANLNIKKYVVENRCLFDATIPITIAGTANWNTARNLNSNITVPTGATLNINTQVGLAGGTTILVQPGGTLNINATGRLMQSCCSVNGGVTFNIKGTLNVNNGGTLVSKTGYSYLVYGALNILGGATVSKVDNANVIAVQTGGTLNQNAASTNCYVQPTLTGLTFTSGKHYSAGPLVISNSIMNATAALEFKSDVSVQLGRPISATRSGAGAVTVLKGATGCNVQTCSSQPQYRMEEANSSESLDFEWFNPTADEAHHHEAVANGQVSTVLHPNPISSGDLQFGKLVGVYELRTSTGEVVMTGLNANKLNVTGLAKGLYMLKLDDKVEKVVIQ